VSVRTFVQLRTASVRVNYAEFATWCFENAREIAFSRCLSRICHTGIGPGRPQADSGRLISESSIHLILSWIIGRVPQGCPRYLSCACTVPQC
jgi:hypothetical protein